MVPSGPVVVVAAPSSPPPARIVQSTTVPETGFPAASVALTTNGLGSRTPASALWLLPETMVRALATAAMAFSVKVTGVSPVTAAS